MRRACLASLFAPLILAACDDRGGQPPLRPVDPDPAAASPAPAAPVGPTADRIRTDILTALAARPAGLEIDSPAGRAVLDRFLPADCQPGGALFERICAWRSLSGAEGVADISLIIDDGLILAAVVRGLPQGVEGWDCQPAVAPPDHALCMATRVSSAQSEAWSGYWNARAR